MDVNLHSSNNPIRKIHFAGDPHGATCWLTISEGTSSVAIFFESLGDARNFLECMSDKIIAYKRSLDVPDAAA